MCHALLISNSSIANELTCSSACNNDINLYHYKPKVILFHKKIFKMSPTSIQYICEESGNHCLVLSHATYHCISFEAKESHFCSILLLHKIPSVLPNYVLLLFLSFFPHIHYARIKRLLLYPGLKYVGVKPLFLHL